ncbi:MAG TPA: hypothetical protein VJ931_08815, partial [Actinomycetota bacterium]|nr:hypothetical protein [Actinomycetota bacterium]
RNRGGYWQVKVYAGLDPLTGKQRFDYDRAKAKREAGRVEAALKTKVAEGRSRGTAARTVADLVERWYEWRQGVKEISPTTLEGYRHQIDQRIIPALGRIPVRRLDVETLDGFYAELRRRGKAGGQPLSASTVRAVHTVLSGSLRQAVAWGWIHSADLAGEGAALKLASTLSLSLAPPRPTGGVRGPPRAATR